MISLKSRRNSETKCKLRRLSGLSLDSLNQDPLSQVLSLTQPFACWLSPEIWEKEKV